MATLCALSTSLHVRISVRWYLSQENIIKSNSFNQKVNLSWLIGLTVRAGFTAEAIWWTLSIN